MPWIGTCECGWTVKVDNRNHVGKEMDNHAFNAYASTPWVEAPLWRGAAPGTRKVAPVRHADYTITPSG